MVRERKVEWERNWENEESGLMGFVLSSAEDVLASKFQNSHNFACLTKVQFNSQVLKERIEKEKLEGRGSALGLAFSN